MVHAIRGAGTKLKEIAKPFQVLENQKNDIPPPVAGPSNRFNRRIPDGAEESISRTE